MICESALGIVVKTAMGYEFIESKDISTVGTENEDDVKLLNKFTTILHVESAEKTFFTLQSVHGTEVGEWAGLDCS